MSFDVLSNGKRLWAGKRREGRFSDTGQQDRIGAFSAYGRILRFFLATLSRRRRARIPYLISARTTFSVQRWKITHEVCNFGN